MSLLTTALDRMEDVKKPQRRFMEALFVALMRFIGRATMSNLSRYSDLSIRQIRYAANGGCHSDKNYFDSARFNLNILDESGIANNKSILALDPTFLKKAGKKTHGLGHFYNGSNSRAEYGLEATVIALIDVVEETAYCIYAEQTPPKIIDDDENNSKSKKRNKDSYTSIDFTIDLLAEKKSILQKCSKVIAVDGAFAKEKFVRGATELDYEVVSRLRKDAYLRYYYTGPKTKTPGRPKTYDGKVEFNNLNRMNSEYVIYKGKSVKVFTGNVNHKTFKREIKVVIFTNDKEIIGILLSTDINLSAAEIVKFYTLRFQIEFLIRDGKQHTGLGHFQVRDENGIHFFINASFTALNLMKLEDREHQGGDADRVTSIESWKRLKYNEKYAEVICETLGIDHEAMKNHPRYQETIRFGVYAA